MLSNFPCVNTIKLNEHLNELEEQDKYEKCINKEYEILLEEFIKEHKCDPSKEQEDELYQQAEEIVAQQIEESEQTDYDYDHYLMEE